MSQFIKPEKVDAMLWDFDGTLANSAAKNITITKQILARVAPHLTGEGLPRFLQSEAEYHFANHNADHWRELYSDFFGLTTAEIDAAAPLWETYQMADNTEVRLFDGVRETVQQFAHLPQGICSANVSHHIRQVLTDHGIISAFQSVVGYEDLPRQHQKPAPDGGLKCLQELFGAIHDKTIVFVGDHIADVLFARGLSERLDTSNKVISVVITHSGANPKQWREQPDVIVEKPSDLADCFMT